MPSFPRRAVLTALAALVLTPLAACSKAGAGTALAAGGPRPAAAAAARMQWVRYDDPSEHAFSLEVPTGWSATGGSRRMSAVEIRTGVTLRSPDGQIEIFYGDNDVPVFTTPNQYLEMGGFTEGSTYSPGYGTNLIVARYRPGEAFAADWGQGRTGRTCADAKLNGAKALPRTSQDMDMAYANGGVRTSIRAGEARFSCSLNGAAGVGYVFAATELVEAQGHALWDVKSLAGFTAPANREAEAADILARVAASFKVDPQWAAQQQGLTANVSHIVADTQAAMSRSIHDSFAYQQASHDRTAREVDQGIRGTNTFNDPVEGPVELENAEHQWRLPDGSHAATNTSQPPAPGAVELQRQR
jgi:hypothetical protein